MQDIGVTKLAQKIAPRLEIHASTQQTVTNTDGVMLRKSERGGATRVVIGRELSVEEIKYITARDIEVIMNRSIARSKEQISSFERFQIVQISSFELSSLVCTAKRIKNNKYIFIRIIAGGIVMTIFRFDFQDLIVFLGNHQCQKRQPWMKQYSTVLQSIVINPT